MASFSEAKPSSESSLPPKHLETAYSCLPSPSPHISRQSLYTPGPVASTTSDNEVKTRISPVLCMLCGLEKGQEAKYTCPRCGIKTCSVSCSKRHKESSRCSGERNKAAYVPMKDYGWGSMMNDYTFLEDIGRKVGEVGREIVRGGYSHPNTQNSFEGGSRGRGRGVGMKRGRGVGGKTKRDIWKMQMEVRDVDVDFLPLGMKRRKVNQSSWDFKHQAALLTLEFKFYPPLQTTSGSPASSPRPHETQPLTLLTHRTNSSQSLAYIIHSLVLDRSKKEALKGKPTGSEASSCCPEWLKSMVLFPRKQTGNSSPKLKIVMRAPVDPVLILNELRREVEETKGEREYKSGLGNLLSSRLAAYAKPSQNASAAAPAPLKRKLTPYPSGFKFPKVYYALDSEKALLDALRHTTFVEYPTIEAFGEDDERLRGCLLVQPGKLGIPDGVMRHGTAMDPATVRGDGSQPERKRRKLDPKEAKEKIKGLIGDYGSDSDETATQEMETDKKGVMSLVEDYAASDEDDDQAMLSTPPLAEDAAADSLEDDGLHDEDAEGEDDLDLDDGDGDEELDAAALLELVRQVKGEQWAKEQERINEDVLDWDGSDLDLDAEGEAHDEDEEDV